MTEEAVAILECAKALGISLTLAVDADGAPCVLWRAPKGTTSLSDSAYLAGDLVRGAAGMAG